MNNAEREFVRVCRLLFAVVLAASLWIEPAASAQNAPASGQSAGSAQSSATQQSQQSPSQKISSGQNGAAQNGAAQNPPVNPTAPSPAEPPADQEVKITPSQAEELFHSVDEILEFDSKQTGLPIRREVKRKLIRRDEVVSYLTKHVDDEDTKRLLRSELVLKKFGLLPPRF